MSLSEAFRKTGPRGRIALWAAYAVYALVVISLVVVPALEQGYVDTIQGAMDDYYEYDLAFYSDGTIKYYTVERHDAGAMARITLNYSSQSNVLNIERSENVKRLEIDCREMFRGKAMEIFGRDPVSDTNLYKQFFILAEGGRFTVNVHADDVIEELRFKDAPMPYEVRVDNLELWRQNDHANVSYQYDYDGLVITNVPQGDSTVVIDFQSPLGNDPPTAVIDAPSTGKVGVPVTFDASASTDGGTIELYQWDFGEGNFSTDAVAQHTYAQAGTYDVILSIRDDDMQVRHQNHTITVVVDTLAPEGALLNPLDGELLSDVGYAIEVRDLGVRTDDDVVSALLQVRDATGWFIPGEQTHDPWVPGIGTVVHWDTHSIPDGAYDFRVLLGDDAGNEGATTSTRASVDNTNPIADAGSDGQVDEKTLYTFDGSASHDPGNEGAANKGITNFTWFFGDGAQGWGPRPKHTFDQGGLYANTLIVWDAGGNFNVDVVNVTVRNVVDDPPVISAFSNRKVHWGSDYRLDVGPYISDPDTDSDDLTVTTSDPGYIDVTNFNLTINYPQSMVGQSRSVTLSVADEHGTTEYTFLVDVTNNYPPEALGMADVTFQEGTTYALPGSLDDFFSDADGDALDYAPLQTDFVKVEIEGDALDISTFQPYWSGEDTVTIRARDPSGAIVEDTIRVTVTPYNYVPRIEGVPDPIYIPYDFEFPLDLSPYLWDDDPIEYLDVASDRNWTSVAGQVLRFHYNATWDGTPFELPLTLTVDDGELQASLTIQVNVSANMPPTLITPIRNVTLWEDNNNTRVGAALADAFDLSSFFSDSDGSITRWVAVSKDGNLTVNVTAAGKVSFQSVENWHGETLVTFGAQDDFGAVRWDTITVVVESVNDAPTHTAFPREILTITEGGIWTIDLNQYFGDVDGDVLTYTCNNDDVEIDVWSGIATWRPGNATSLTGVVFTASDGQAEVSSAPLDVEVLVRQKTSPFTWLLVALIAAIGGAGAVLAYRTLKYRYYVKEVFLLSNVGGLLLSHVSAGDTRTVDEMIVGGMLSAVQDFVKDSFASGGQQASVEGLDVSVKDDARGLGRLEYEDFQIIIERGQWAYLAVVIEGYDSPKLRKRMQLVLGEVETQYGDVLSDWDGDMDKIRGTTAIVAALIPESDAGPAVAAEEPVEEVAGPAAAGKEVAAETAEKEPEEQAAEEAEAYECPDCQASLTGSETSCPSCGQEFASEEETDRR